MKLKLSNRIDLAERDTLVWRTPRSPSPQPSPRGEGEPFGSGPAAKACHVFEAMDDGAPSPRGEGRGEGDRGVRIFPQAHLGKKRLSTQHAFTLIELLLVLVILGILAAIVVPKFSGRTEQARNTAAQSQISTFGTALDAYEVDMGFYPKGKNGLGELVSAPRETANWKGPYLKSEIPLDPWQHPYVYECPGKHNPSSYDLYSLGPDGRANSDDDITNWSTQKR